MNLDQRIAQLKNDWIDEDPLTSMYGLALTESVLQRDFIRWGQLQRRPRPVIRGNEVSRFALESFFQQQKQIPLKWAAAKLGMTQGSLEDVIIALEDSGRVNPVRTGSENFVPEEIDRLFIQALPPLQGRVFGNHDSFCKRLHEAIESELRISVEPLYCVTAARLGEPDFAYSFCVVTDQPAGLRYRIWLDFKKPMNLTPDTCSYVAFFENPDRLRTYLMQEEPKKPAAL
jgi:hypothetical protein